MVYTIHNLTNKTLQKNDGSLWKQLLLSFTASLPFFTHGILTNTLTVSVHAGHFVITPNDAPSSTTAMILAAAASGPLYCYTIDRYGRKIGIYIINLVQAATCIPLFLVFDTSNICLHVLAGISLAGIITVLPIYVREISSDRHRGLTMSLKMIMIATGYLMKLAAGLELMVYLIVATATLQLLSMYFLLESPCYLIMAHKWEAALSHVARIKCLPEDNPSVVEALEQLKNESERATAHGRLYLHTILKNPIWRDATKIGVVLCTVMTLCGSVVFLDQTKTLMQLRSDPDPDHRLVMYSLFAGSALCFLSVHFLERKYLLSSALTMMALSMGVLAVFTQMDLTITEYRWLPVAALVVLIVGYGAAWGLSAMITVEILNLEIRATVVGAVFVYVQLVKLSHLLCHQYIEDYVGIYTMLYIFSFVNLYGAVYAFFRLPDLKNKSVRQIERQLKRVPLLEFKSQIN